LNFGAGSVEGIGFAGFGGAGARFAVVGSGTGGTTPTARSTTIQVTADAASASARMIANERARLRGRITGRGVGSGGVVRVMPRDGAEHADDNDDQAGKPGGA
jgi:hypothetical protein